MFLRTVAVRVAPMAPLRVLEHTPSWTALCRRAFFSTIPQQTQQNGVKYSEQQLAKGRPVSPHVTIYAFPIVAISSITVRITGVVLTVGASGVGLLSFVHPDVSRLLCELGNSPVGPLAKFCVAFPLLYHWLGGVRHTMWDKMPETVNNKAVEQSSYAIFAAGLTGALGASLISGTPAVEKKPE